MKIICCYTNLTPETKAALPSETRYFDVSHAPDDYFNAFSTIWNQSERFINIEHDIVVPVEQLQELWDCTQPWCTVPYPNVEDTGQLIHGALGVAKFHESLMKYFPSFIRDTEKDKGFRNFFGEAVYAPRHWRILDVKIVLQMHKRGFTYHEHLPPAQHIRKTRRYDHEFRISA